MALFRKPCEIYSVAYRNAFRWKWRHTAANGTVSECLEEYLAFFECVAAARAGGYEPRCEWTAPLILSQRVK
jgi:hypothetical protein